MASTLYLTILMGPMTVSPVPKVVIDALISVEVSVSATAKSGFQLSFTLANNSPLPLIFTPLGASLSIPRIVLVASFGGLPQVIMDGIVTHMEVVPDAMQGASTLNITGEDLSTLMDITDRSGTSLGPLTPDARVQKILGNYAIFGIQPNVSPVVTPDAQSATEKTYSQQGTDLAYIQQLAREAGYVFYIQPGPQPGQSQAYWGPQIKMGVPQPALNVNMDAWTNVESLNLRCEPLTAVTPIVYIQDQNSGQSQQIPIPSANPLDPPLGGYVPTPLKTEYLKDTAKLPPAQAMMIGWARASDTADIVTASGTLSVLRYGGILQARQLVGLRGAGQTFDGLYYVDSTTHQIKLGEYKQSFTLKRNALISNMPTVPVTPF
jgi:hypothetical protein